MKNSEPEVLDYVYVFWLLGIFDKELNILMEKTKIIMLDAQRENFDLAIEHTSKNLEEIGVASKMQPISLNYGKYRTKNLELLVEKQFDKLSYSIKNQITNGLNTGHLADVENVLKAILKKENKVYSVVSKLMRVARTENTRMRSRAKLDIQDELKKQGINVRRRWVHTLYNPTAIITDTYEPRLDHLSINGQLEDNSGLFHTPLASGRAPGMFGVPQEDINCRCDVDFVVD